MDELEVSGTIASVSGSNIVLDSSASTVNDTYNKIYLMKITVSTVDYYAKINDYSVHQNCSWKLVFR